MVFPDCARHGPAAQFGDRRREAPPQEIDVVHHSSKGDALDFGIHAGVGAWKQNGD
ncbi:MAG: hypothetical protein ACLPGW_09655 [Roseiarcus sp.]